MKRIYKLAALAVVMIGMSTGLWAQAFIRFAFVIGANDGGAGKVKLQYAVSDAQSVSKVLSELGGVKPGDIVFYTDPSPAQVIAGMKDLAAKINAVKSQYSRVEVIFYYSGHSDEKGLLLKGELLTYSKLKSMIQELPADVRIAILDSCASGMLTKQKGGVKVAPFLLDTSTQMKGYAFLTSSSADEAAQESDLIGASFFTHYLISALRGAADANQDGKVTLNETYQFAFDETLARTEQTLSGPQHPGYDIQMSGSGDVVMTDIRVTSATLLLSEKLGGRVFIRNSSGKLVAEMFKLPNKPVQLGLEPGSYVITVDINGKLYQTKVTLKAGAPTLVTPANFIPISSEMTVERGDVVSVTNIQSQTVTTTNMKVITLVTLEEQETDEEALQNVLDQAKLNAQKYKTNQNGEITVNDQTNNSLVIKTGEDGVVLLSIPQLPFINFPGFQVKNAAGTEYAYTVIGINNHLNPAGKKVMHNICFDYLSGSSDRLLGASFSFISHEVSDFMIGYMMSLIINEGGNFNAGAMNAGIGNKTKGYMLGFQAAGVFNDVGNDFTGFHIAGIFNKVNNRMMGMQIAGIFNEAKGSVGMQTAGIFNTADSMLGMQVAGIFNKSRDMNGIQVSGLFNMAVGVMNGLQVSTVNMVGDLNGGQVGVVNVAAGTVNGFQIGVVNISDEMNGIPIGLVNISKNGYNRIQFWWDETSFANVGFTLGTRYIYNSFSVGVNKDINRMTVGLGIGIHFPMKGCFVNMQGDVAAIMPFDQPMVLFSEGQNVNSLVRLKLGFGVEVWGNLAFVAGFSYTLFVPASEVGIPGASTDDSMIKPSIGTAVDWINYNIKSWPGFYVGIEF
ncbi:MAG: hypothetical protein A2Y33_16635 [Spirochaetes bacterium GWF1_51_8]|nr:MAG: hypothetical protein A2Y33_16635 [Spirochaetes bacterium GWF1_51_8]